MNTDIQRLLNGRVATEAAGGQQVAPRIMSFGLVMGLAVLIFASVISVTAQTPSASVAAVAASADDNRYRIGPGDVLEIRVLKAPELSREAVRVDQRGMIRMPMITSEISAACLTEAELQEKIATLYLEYKRNPIVDVFVKEYQSQPVSIVGELNNPHPEGSQFRLHRQVRLLELIAMAGGVSEHAGQTVNVVHAGGVDLCAPHNDASVNSDLGVLISYRLEDTMKGLPEANPLLRAGDIVVVPEGAQAYVVGNVIKPSTIPLREPTTVSRAIAMAGGTGPASKKDQVRIVRQVPGSQIKQEIFVDLSAIEKRKAQDVILIPNDIVDVPTSATKSFLRSLVGAVAPAMAQVPARIP